MSPLVERLTELRRHLDHLMDLRPRVPNPECLAQELSLHNNVLFSLLTLCQLVIDIAGELSARRKDRFEDYTGAVRNLARDPRFSPELVRTLERLPGIRNVIIHEYVVFDLSPLEEFVRIVAAIEAGADDPEPGSGSSAAG